MQKLIASVIVLNYNCETFVPNCLTSLMDQDMLSKDYEIIFANNGSIDRSVNIVQKRFPDVRLVKFDRNYCFGEGNNRAVEYASGKYVVFLNIDTVVH